ncbi:MAG: hypothetical protein IJS73_00640 [Paludibacteraceae bacterium]|nr:hypothetical protein [Paludibacteraceae bacterium]
MLASLSIVSDERRVRNRLGCGCRWLNSGQRFQSLHQQQTLGGVCHYRTRDECVP